MIDPSSDLLCSSFVLTPEPERESMERTGGEDGGRRPGEKEIVRSAVGVPSVTRHRGVRPVSADRISA
jgi:hypothetical protein